MTARSRERCSEMIEVFPHYVVHPRGARPVDHPRGAAPTDMAHCDPASAGVLTEAPAVRGCSARTSETELPHPFRLGRSSALP
jgi:hypothetical protein